MLGRVVLVTKAQSSTGREQRADARQNRAGILDAAGDLFADRGVDVQMSDVAEHAGLAIGTVYRHFATKEALVDSLLTDRLTSTAAAGRAAVADQRDPWQALAAFLRTITASQLADRALSQYIGGRIVGSAELRRKRNDLFADFEELVRATRDAGQLRGDVEANDIRVAMICIARASTGHWPDPDWLLERYLPIVLDGLRAPGRSTLSGQPAPTAELDQAATGRGESPFRRGRRRWDPQA
jgi:AcrR family transcriptional regulator